MGSFLFGLSVLSLLFGGDKSPASVHESRINPTLFASSPEGFHELSRDFSPGEKIVVKSLAKDYD
jgi:hypothetical protein